MKRTEEQLFSHLHRLAGQFSCISDIRGKGLLAAIEFEDDISGRVLNQANAAGVLLNGVKPNAVRFMPALNILAEELDEGIGRLETALKSL